MKDDGTTPKQVVLEKHPKAHAYHWKDCWVIYVPYEGFSGNRAIGNGKTAAKAWADAAARERSGA